MKVNGKITKQMGQENFSILMEMFMMEIGPMIRLMVMELIRIQMELNIKDNGRMIFSMGQAWKNGQMEVDMTEPILKEKNKDKVFMYGVMDQNILVTGLIIR